MQDSEFTNKWEQILQGIPRSKVPMYLIKKIVLRLPGKKQKTINIEKLMRQGIAPQTIEEIVNNQLQDYPDVETADIEFNLEVIAAEVEPTTELLLKSI